jgi:hypothetical protein
MGATGKRVVVAGIVGGIAMFLWSSVAHVLLPLGEIGISTVTHNEDAFLASMHSALGEQHGLYLFPAGGNSTDAAAMQQYAQKIAVGPSGLIVYHPSGAEALAPRQLVTEFLTEILAALIIAFLLSQMRSEQFATRFGLTVVLAVLAALSTNISYWNWYGFPLSYTLTYMSIQIAGFIAAGAVAAAILKPRAAVADPVHA